MLKTREIILFCVSAAVPVVLLVPSAAYGVNVNQSYPVEACIPTTTGVRTCPVPLGSEHPSTNLNTLNIDFLTSNPANSVEVFWYKRNFVGTTVYDHELWGSMAPNTAYRKTISASSVKTNGNIWDYSYAWIWTGTNTQHGYAVNFTMP